jgi:hypothetical protein
MTPAPQTPTAAMPHQRTLSAGQCKPARCQTAHPSWLHGGKGGKGNGGNDDGKAVSSGQSWIMHRIRIVLPSPLKQWYNGNKGGQVKAKATKRAIATATRVASNNDGNVCGGKGNGNGEEGGG